MLLLSFFCFGKLQSQVTVAYSSSELLLSIKKLNTVGSVLYIAAHPDDENTRLLAYLASERKLRTGYLSITRGDGGQNLIGNEQGELLGLIRTHELLAARRVDGAEQFFTRANDFGYSKNPEETFTFWNKDSVLSDVVLAIRKFKPDVIICRFPTTGEGGHGHHTASAILAQEAFEAAADPKKFPDQLKSVEIWQPRRLFWNTFNFGGTNTTSPEQLKTDVGIYNVLLGKGYGEIAAESRSMHKSQGFGSAKQRGSNVEYFKFLKGDSVKTDLFEGIKLDWKRFNGKEIIHELIAECLNKYNMLSPENSLGTLISIYKQIQLLDEQNSELKYWKQQKLKETEFLLLGCAGLWMEAVSNDYSAIPGQDVITTVQLINRNKCNLKINKVSFFDNSDTVLNLNIKTNDLLNFKHRAKISQEAPYSNPYWLNQKHSEGLYSVCEKSLVGKPENDGSSKVLFDITLEGLNLTVARNLVYKYTDPVKGEIYRPFEILPPVTINLSEKTYVFENYDIKTMQLVVKANKPNVEGKIDLKLPIGWKLTIQNSDFKLTNKGEEITVIAEIQPEKNATEGKIQASAFIGNQTYNKSIKRIEYDHIPYQFILSDAESKLVLIDLKKKNSNIAYIPGAGDEVLSCLKQIGYSVTLLTEELLAKNDLSKYSAIVTGVRAYNTNERLQLHHPKLMEYVKKGGNLIVQYNTNSRVGPLQAKIGPYPFSISRDRVTNEKAEIKFINPAHPVLNTPNKISQKDFDGWIQERGIYFASEIDKQYETIFSSADPGEKENSGSLIIGKYGKGNFAYTGLAFFRELPSGVSGAYRLFANLISLPKN